MFKISDLTIHTYKVYGLKIESEIPMTELLSIDKSDCSYPDVIISYGVVPKEIEGSVINGENIKLAEKEFYMYVKETAHYYVADGNRIIVELETQKNMEEVKIFLLGTCLGILLKQRSTIAIHGGSVAINGQGLIITGYTGAGKSTLTSALRNEGFTFLADDVSALDRDLAGNLVIHPTYPQLKLCRGAMERIGYDIQKYTVIDASRDKYAVPLQKNFLNFPVSLNSIYEISIGETNNVEILELLGNEKIKAILRNIYRIEIIRYLGLEPHYFKKCIEIAINIPFYRLIRPKDGFTVSEQINLIRSTL